MAGPGEERTDVMATMDSGTLALIERLEQQLETARRKNDRIAAMRLEQRIRDLRKEPR
jgi:hypothetical protein